MVIVALRILSPTEKAYMAARLQAEPVARAEEGERNRIKGRME